MLTHTEYLIARLTSERRPEGARRITLASRRAADEMIRRPVRPGY